MRTSSSTQATCSLSGIGRRLAEPGRLPAVQERNVRILGAGFVAMIVGGLGVMSMGGRSVIVHAPVALVARRALVVVGYYEGQTARVTVDARCRNVSVQAFGSTWFGIAPWLATGERPNLYAGTMRRSGFDDALFSADGGGRVSFLRLRHGYILGLPCEL